MLGPDSVMVQTSMKFALKIMTQQKLVEQGWDEPGTLRLFLWPDHATAGATWLAHPRFAGFLQPSGDLSHSRTMCYPINV